MARTYEAIASQTVSGTPSSITFSNIAATWTDLVLIVHATTDTTRALRLQFNSDTGSNYSATFLRGNGSSAISSRESSQTSIRLTEESTPTNTAYTTQVLQVMSYANTSVNKTLLGAGAQSGIGVDRVVGLWRSTAAITSITVLVASGTFAAGTLSLYGIKAA